MATNNARLQQGPRIPGTHPTRGVPHYTNHRRLAAFEKATGLKALGDHAQLLDWLLPILCPTVCNHCDQLGVRMRGPVWVTCDHCEGSVWLVSPTQRERLRKLLRPRFPQAIA